MQVKLCSEYGAKIVNSFCKKYSPVAQNASEQFMFLIGIDLS
jgi:hypothetical protein